jgi:hypothetical protein
MNAGDSRPGRFPVLHVLLAGGLLVAVCGGWVAFRLAGKSKPTEPDTPDRVVAVTPRPAPAPNPPAEFDELVNVAPAPREPGTPVPPPEETPEPQPAPAIAANEPPIDDLIQKEIRKDDWAQPKPRPKGAINLAAITPRPEGGRDPKDVAAAIDRLIDARLAEAKVTASPRADDAEFLRRVYLDLTGCVPPVAKTKAFLADQSPDKRIKLIDELLASHDFGEHFAHYWHELIVKRDPETNHTIQAQDVFVKWLTRQFNTNRPWDQTVHAMLTAAGDQALAGETFFVLANAENGQPAANKIVGTAAALFLGNQLQCAECHVHPVVPAWKQQDFWGLAAFFGKTHAVRTGMAKMPNTLLARITDGPAGPKVKGANAPHTLPDGSIPIPDPRNDGKTIGAARAKLFGDGYQPVPAASVTRAFAADWFTAASNPYFPRAAVNRMWSQFFGRGLVNPLDDIRPDSHVSHPELLQLLAEEFVAAKFEVKHMIRCLCRTEAYQRTSRVTGENRDDEELLSHAALKAIPPRELFASLALITDGQVRMPKEEVIGKQGASADGFAFYDTREYDESPTEYTYGVPQLLRLMNTRLPLACDAVGRKVAQMGSREKGVEHLFLLALSRYPSSTERSHVAAFVARHPDPAKGYSAALWSLLQTAEFINNH